MESAEVCTVPGAHKDTTWLVSVSHSHWVSASSTVANKGLRCPRVRAHATEFVTVVACTTQHVESALGLPLSLSLSQGGCLAVRTHQALQSALEHTCMLAGLSLSPPLSERDNYRRTGHWTTQNNTKLHNVEESAKDIANDVVTSNVVQLQKSRTCSMETF